MNIFNKISLVKEEKNGKDKNIIVCPLNKYILLFIIWPVRPRSRNPIENHKESWRV